MKKLINLIDQIDNMKDMNNVIASLKIRRAFLKNELSRAARAKFSIGDKVTIPTKGRTLEGVIHHIQIKNATVRIDGDLYKCPLSLLEAA